MAKSNSKEVVEMGVSTTPQSEVIVNDFVIEQYDDDIRPARNMTKQRGSRPLAASVQVVFDRFVSAIEFAQANDGKAQLSFPHENYPLKGRFPNKDISNAIVSGKKKFNNIAFQVIVDAVNRSGEKLNASVIRFKVKETETETSN
jgi:hypothetical protein